MAGIISQSKWIRKRYEMVEVTALEKEVLSKWVPGVDLLKVKILVGPRIDWVCSLLGASAITLGHTIFATSNSWIMRYPAEHPVRLALLVHELFHVHQEKEKGLAWYLIQYNIILSWLVVWAIITKRWFTPSKLAHFIGKHHPFEKPAYKLQAEFLGKYWTDEEAEKWKK